MLYLTTLILSVFPTVGQVDSNYQELKDLEWVQGTWKREWVEDQNTAKTSKGDKVAKEWRFAWTANKNAILVTQMLSANGKTLGQLDALFGWNKNREQIVGAGYGTNGISGGGWTITTDEKKFTISAGASDWDFVAKGENALIVIDAGGARHEFQRVSKKKS